MCIPESLASVHLNRETVHGHDQQDGSTVSCLGEPRCAEASLPFAPTLSWLRAGSGRIQHSWFSVLALALVSRLVAMTTGKRQAH